MGGSKRGPHENVKKKGGGGDAVIVVVWVKAFKAQITLESHSLILVQVDACINDKGIHCLCNYSRITLHLISFHFI